MPMGIEGFGYADLYDAAKLRDLLDVVRPMVRRDGARARAQFEAYRASKGQGMTPLAEERSAPRRGAVRRPLRRQAVRGRGRARALPRRACARNDPIWRFRKDFVKKRVLRADAAKGWTLGAGGGARRSEGGAAGDDRRPQSAGTTDEEATIAAADAAAARGRRGGAQGRQGRRRPMDRRAAARARKVRATRWAVRAGRVWREARRRRPRSAGPSAFALDAIEAWLAARRRDEHDPVRRWVDDARRRSRSTTRTSSRSSAPTRRCPSSSSARSTSAASASASR